MNNERIALLRFRKSSLTSGFHSGRVDPHRLLLSLCRAALAEQPL